MPLHPVRWLLAVVLLETIALRPPALPAQTVPDLSPRIIRTLEADSRVWSARMSPNGKWLAGGTRSRQIFIWSGSTGEKFRTIDVSASGAVRLVFTPDGKGLVAAPGGHTADHSLHLWDLDSGKETRSFTGHTDSVYGVDLSPDGTRMISAGADRTVRLWEVNTGRELAVFKGHTEDVLRVAFSADNITAGSGSDDGTLRLWNTSEPGAIRVLEHGEPVYGVCFSPDGRWVVSIGVRRMVLWQVSTGRVLHQWTGCAALTAAFSPDGLLLASCGNDRVIHLWEVMTGEEVARVGRLEGFTTSISFSPDGRQLITAGAGDSVQLWDIAGMGVESKSEVLSTVDLHTLWKQLSGTDSSVAFRAVCTLANNPERSVPFLKAALHPPSKKKILQWIDDLDDDRFKVREQALADLTQWAEHAEPLLRKALAAPKSIEAGWRLEKIVAPLDAKEIHPQRMQMLRGLCVLEKLATPAAIEVIEDLCSGPEDMWVTGQAKKVLRRIHMRSLDKP